MSALYLVAGIVLGLFAYWLLQDTSPLRLALLMRPGTRSDAGFGRAS